MKRTEIILQFEDRVGSAGRYREAAALSLVVSVILFLLYGISRARIGAWGGVVLAAGVVLAMIAFALAVLSFMSVRCPNCGRVLGEVVGAFYCPSCGVALKTDAPPGPASAGVLARGEAARAEKRRGSASRKRERNWEPRSGSPGIDDFPQEEYPKNIRMFTTPDEMELTRRYLRLIENDNRNQSAQAGRSLPKGGSTTKPAGLPQPTSRPERRNPKSRPSWRRMGRASPEEEALGFLARLLLRIRRNRNPGGE